MYSLKSVNARIIDFKTFDDKEVVIDVDRNLLIGNYTFPKVDFANWSIVDKVLIYSGARGNSGNYIVDLSTGTKTKSDNYYSFHNCFSPRKCPVMFDLKFDNNHKFIYKVGLYDYDDDCFVKEYDILNSKSLDYYDSENIIAHDLETIFAINHECDIIWTVKVSEFLKESKVRSFHFLNENKLYFAGTNNELFRVSIDKGELFVLFILREDIDVAQLKLDKETGKLLHPLNEFDINNCEQKSIDVVQNMNVAPKEEFTVYSNTDFCFNESLLFFSATQDYYPKKGANPVGVCHLFAVDKNTREQVWHYKLNEGKKYKGVKKMEATSDKLYVLDHGNNLYIFEKNP